MPQSNSAALCVQECAHVPASRTSEMLLLSAGQRTGRSLAYTHTYVIGATRTGKTNYLLSQVRGAFAFIDKHGRAAQQIAETMECIYWRPADPHPSFH